MYFLHCPAISRFSQVVLIIIRQIKMLVSPSIRYLDEEYSFKIGLKGQLSLNIHSAGSVVEDSMKHCPGE